MGLFSRSDRTRRRPWTRHKLERRFLEPAGCGHSITHQSRQKQDVASGESSLRGRSSAAEAAEFWDSALLASVNQFYGTVCALDLKRKPAPETRYTSLLARHRLHKCDQMSLRPRSELSLPTTCHHLAMLSRRYMGTECRWCELSFSFLCSIAHPIASTCSCLWLLPPSRLK